MNKCKRGSLRSVKSLAAAMLAVVLATGTFAPTAVCAKEAFAPMTVSVKAVDASVKAADSEDPFYGGGKEDPVDPSDPGQTPGGEDPVDPSDPGQTPGGEDPVDPSDPGQTPGGEDPVDPSDPGQTPGGEDPVEDTELRVFVSRLYQNFLGREADEKGLVDWIRVLKDSSCSAATLIKGFVFSREFQANPLDDEDYINAFYMTILGREADEGGLWSWIDVLDIGCTRKKVLEGFLNSSEMGNLAKSLGIEAGSYYSDEIVDNAYPVTSFVGRLYWYCLGRRPDAQGIKVWVDGLVNRRMTGAEAAWGFFGSREYISRKWDDEAYVYFLYGALFDREPEEEGLLYWHGLLKKGVSRHDVFLGFAGSQEFANLCAAYGIEAYGIEVD